MNIDRISKPGFTESSETGSEDRVPDRIHHARKTLVHIEPSEIATHGKKMEGSVVGLPPVPIEPSEIGQR